MRRSVLFLAAFLLFALVAQAGAAEISRDEYRERVEPSCKQNTEANQRILAGVRKRVKAGELGVAAQQFAKVPMPAADEAKLSRWLAGVRTEVELLEATGRALAKRDKHQAQKLVVQLSTNANRTNAGVISFEFTHCWFQPAKYT